MSSFPLACASTRSSCVFNPHDPIDFSIVANTVLLLTFFGAPRVRRDGTTKNLIWIFILTSWFNCTLLVSRRMTFCVKNYRLQHIQSNSVADFSWRTYSICTWLVVHALRADSCRVIYGVARSPALGCACSTALISLVEPMLRSVGK